MTGVQTCALPISLNITQDGQNVKDTVQMIDAQGHASTGVVIHAYDGQPHPTTGSPDYDASTYTRVDAHTINYSRTKAGKVAQTGTMVVSQDGKTATFTAQGTDASGRGWDSVQVYDKQ